MAHPPRSTSSKDERASISSSARDSAYQSMTSTHQQPTMQRQGQFMEQYLPQGLFSPAVSSASQPMVFPASTSDYGEHFGQTSQAPNEAFGNPNSLYYPEASGHAFNQNSLEGVVPSWQGPEYSAFTSDPVYEQPSFAQTWGMTSSFTRTSHIVPADNVAEFEDTQLRTGPISRPRLSTIHQVSNSSSIPQSVVSVSSASRYSNNPSPHPVLQRFPSAGDQSSVSDDKRNLSPTLSYVSTSQTSLKNDPKSLKGSRTGSLVMPGDDIDEVYAVSQTTAAQTAGEEAARNHPLYHTVTVQSDGLYHCPFAAEDCGHKPTKLKCNYDKYIDSHLKPFRCKVVTCVDVQFSSTACLLRHEREAHGAHGHGEKPNLCFFPECERSQPGHGFPRRYNLFDHMKRVHNYIEQPGDGATGNDASSKKNSRKRSAPTLTKEVPEKRAKITKPRPASLSNVQTAQDRKVKALTELNSQWLQRLHSLQQRVMIIQGPQDSLGHDHISDDFEAMNKLRAQINDLG